MCGIQKQGEKSFPFLTRDFHDGFYHTKRRHSPFKAALNHYWSGVVQTCVADQEERDDPLPDGHDMISWWSQEAQFWSPSSPRMRGEASPCGKTFTNNSLDPPKRGFFFLCSLSCWQVATYLQVKSEQMIMTHVSV